MKQNLSNGMREQRSKESGPRKLHKELYEQIKIDERAYRYEGIGPNWPKIAELILKYEEDSSRKSQDTR